MGHRFIEDIAIADVAFEVYGKTVDELFISAALALLDTMVKNSEKVRGRVAVKFLLEADDLDDLLIRFLNHLVLYKDSKSLIFGRFEVCVKQTGERWIVKCVAHGEKLDEKRHEPRVDVKSATLHMLEVKKTNGEWCGRVVLDV